MGPGEGEGKGVGDIMNYISKEKKTTKRGYITEILSCIRHSYTQERLVKKARALQVATNKKDMRLRLHTQESRRRRKMRHEAWVALGGEG